MFLKFINEGSLFENKRVIYYHKFTYVYKLLMYTSYLCIQVTHLLFISDFSYCIILWTYFDKNIKRVMNTNPLAEE